MTGKANSFQNSLKEDSKWRMGLETLRRASIAHSDTSVQKKKTHQQMPIGCCLIFQFVPFPLTGCNCLRLVLLSLMRQRGEEMPHMCTDKVQHLTIITILQVDRCISFKHRK